jgi:hypothetical protein
MMCEWVIDKKFGVIAHLNKGGSMEDKLKEVYDCLKIMDMMLYNYTCDPPRGVVPFKSTQEMAKYFRAMLHTALPKEYCYKEE